MIKIRCLKEKQLLIAYHIKINDNLSVSPQKVFLIWNNWYKNDFRIKGLPTLVVRNNHLVFSIDDVRNNYDVLAEIDKLFQRTYDSIFNLVEKYDKCQIEEFISKQRARQRCILKNDAKNLGYKVKQVTTSNNSMNHVAFYRLYKNENNKRIVKDGHFSSLMDYLKTV